MGRLVFLSYLLYCELYILTIAKATAPVCSPASYAVSVGINTTAGTTLTSVVCTDADAGNTITYSIDSSSDGNTYLKMVGAAVNLANRLDVEYGLVKWTVEVLAVDNTGATGTATISLTTFQSTTTTTTTPAPPGYSWFDTQNNVILFGSTAGFTALITACCILMCFRFHRLGTCLPLSCPEYGQCRASCRRQCDCCPLPCDFYAEDNKVPLVEKPQSNKETKPIPEPITTQHSVVSRADTDVEDNPSSDRSYIVTPVVTGNVNLTDVGFDGMKSPESDAPMFTRYGGKRGQPQPRY